MPLVKVVFEKEIHVYKGSLQSFQDFFQFITNTFTKVPSIFSLYYEDDEDKITISCSEDLKALEQASQKLIKIYIQPMQGCQIIAKTNLVNSQIIPDEDDFQIVQKNCAASVSNSTASNSSTSLPQQQSQSQQNKNLGECNVIKQQLGEFMKIDFQKQNQPLCQMQTIPFKLQNFRQERKHRKRQLIKKLVNEEIQNQIQNITMMVAENLKISMPQQYQQMQHQQNTQTDFATKLENLTSVINPVHSNVTCDGCNQHPIIGVRYKCAVCENFDFCEKCEASKQHQHAFLKIRDPSQAPKAIFTAIDDNMNSFIQSVNQFCPDMNQVFENHQQQPQQMKHVYQPIVIDFNSQQPQQQQSNLQDKTVVLDQTIQMFNNNCNEQEQSKKQQKNKKKYSWTVKNNAKLIAQYIGGKKQDYYEIADTFQEKSADELVELILTQRSMIENQKCHNSQQEKQCQKVEEKPVEQIKKEVSPKIFEVAKQIAQIMGGSEQSYYDIAEELQSFSVEEIIECILASRENQQEQAIASEAQVNQMDKTCIKQRNFEETPTLMGDHDELQKQQNQQKADKYLKKEFTAVTIAKAEKIAQVFGEPSEIYYGICDAYLFSSVNDIIEMVLNDPSLIEKNSSYK